MVTYVVNYITPEVREKCLVFVKISSIRDTFLLKIRVALFIVWINPYCIAFSIRFVAEGLRLSLRRLILESVKIKESWVKRDISDIR